MIRRQPRATLFPYTPLVRSLRLEHDPAALDAVGLRRLAERPVAAEVALDQPGDPLAQEDRRGALDLAHLPVGALAVVTPVDRKSTRLNSSHANISYAVFCLK